MNEEMQRRFWNKVDKSGDCWNWTAALHEAGYGIFGIGGTRVDRAHRIAYRLCVGDIPPGMQLCHKCDNRKCVRPDHLFVGTNRDNFDDMVAKGRHSTPPPMGGWNRIELSQETIARMGKEPDTEIARSVGVHKCVIARARRRRGIAAVPCQTRFKPLNPGDPHPCWSRRTGGKHVGSRA